MLFKFDLKVLVKKLLFRFSEIFIGLGKGYYQDLY